MITWGSLNAAASSSDVVSLLLSRKTIIYYTTKSRMTVYNSHYTFLFNLFSLCRKSQLLEDLYRANFNLGNICFRNGQHSNAVRCLEQAKDCARKIKDKFSESECFHCIGKV